MFASPIVVITVRTNSSKVLLAKLKVLEHPLIWCGRLLGYKVVLIPAAILPIDTMEFQPVIVSKFD